MNAPNTQDSVTAELARRALQIRLREVPPAVATVVRQCVLDYLGVTLAGSVDPVLRALRDELAEEGGAPQAQIVGSPLRLPKAGAALLNGTASHVLDYDDVNFALMGHPSVPILPAALALGEALDASGEQLMEAFLAGYETECAIGLLVAPGHYGMGFHATATVGSFGAAVACARLLGANELQMRHAIGIAATQAAGLKSMFGTACKPLHAGLAARSGLLAASLARRGFDSRIDALECPQGFAATHSANFDPAAALNSPAGGWHVLHNLFKYHASCYETHATIECARRLRDEHALTPATVARVDVTVNPYCDRICNIAAPVSGLEAKFSLRLTAAFALTGVETADPAMFNDALAQSPDMIALRDKVTVGFGEDTGQGCATVAVHTTDGAVLRTSHNAALPMQDLQAQGARLEEKFRRLATPVIGAARSSEIASLVAGLEALPSVHALAVACAK